ncbi:hypothetical protein SAMN05216337_10277 [Bradyrhizobium brasilense]|uniref:Uncharacterized protein n=1 Tax=Bradyrhizobium brasilense TaxID=1419277 RepID=A0A1G7D6Z0_9BRAD|nr:hypothetical protein SAMN05216337_10277 [Bradyrhizobium brasilense]
MQDGCRPLFQRCRPQDVAGPAAMAQGRGGGIAETAVSL